MLELNIVFCSSLLHSILHLSKYYISIHDLKVCKKKTTVKLKYMHLFQIHFVWYITILNFQYTTDGPWQR